MIVSVSTVLSDEKSRPANLDLGIDRLSRRCLYTFIGVARTRSLFQRFSARAATISRISYDAPLLIAGKPAVVMCACLRVLLSGITIGGRAQSYYRLLISEGIDLYHSSIPSTRETYRFLPSVQLGAKRIATRIVAKIRSFFPFE